MGAASITASIHDPQAQETPRPACYLYHLPYSNLPMNQQIKIQLLHPNAVLPSKAHHGDAAYDLRCVKIEDKGDYVEYSLGIASEIPEGWAAFIYPRSSISNYELTLTNCVGVIDSGYRGEWKARFRRVATSGTIYKHGHFSTSTDLNCVQLGDALYRLGEKVAQVVFQKLPDVTLVQADSLSDSQRGTGGFGSSGR